MTQNSKDTQTTILPMAIIATTLAVFTQSALADNVRIGVLMPLTGGLQAYGGVMTKGAQMAVDEVNEAGGLLGGSVEMIVADTQTKAQPSIDAAKKLTSIQNVSGIIGALSSGNTIPVAKSVASVDGIPIISPTSTAPMITTLQDNDFLFRTVPSDAFQGVALAKISIKQGTVKIAVLYINNDYGDGLAQSFADTFTKLGGTVTALAAFEPNKASYRGELAKLAKDSPQSLLLISYPDDGGITILKQALEEGLFKHFVFADGMRTQKIIDDIGADYLQNSYGTTFRSMNEEAVDNFANRYKSKFGEELPYRSGTPNTYDAMAILLLAIAKCNCKNGSGVRDALRDVSNAPGIEITPGNLDKGLAALKVGQDINYVGAGGDHEFDEYGDVSGTYEHWMINKGQLETVRVFDPMRE